MSSREVQKANYLNQRGWLYFGKKPGLFSFKNRSLKIWVEYWGEIKNGNLSLYKDEEMWKRGKPFKSFNITNSQFYDCTKRKKQPCSIRIVLTQKYNGKDQSPIYISGANLRSIDEFKLDLEEVGGQFMGSYSKKKEYDNKIERIPVSEWKVSDVLLWLKLIGMGKYQNNFQSNRIDGNHLLEMDSETLQTSLNIAEEEADVLEMNIEMLKKFNNFSRKRSIVQSKFRSFPMARGGKDDDDEEEEEVNIYDVVDSLSDESKIKHKFLNTSDLRHHTVVGSKLTKKEHEESVNIELDEEKLLHLEKFDTAKINVKLVVTEVMQTTNLKMKKAISPIVSAIAPKISQRFQFFHTAVIVGPWYLEWTDSEIIIPKRMVAGRAVISADVDTLVVKKNGLKEIADKISEVVVRWNTKYKYRKKTGDSVRDKELLQGNCQDFVDDILKALGLQTEFKGALGEFISRMRNTGKAALEFSPCKEFRDLFDIDKKSIQFDSHAQLDNFCVKIKSELVDIEDVFLSEWTLLKSFDRAFWLRHLKDKDDERYKPLDVKEEDDDGSRFATGCPFKDPRETLSYV